MKKEIKKIKLTDNISYYISDNTIYLFQDEYNFSKDDIKIIGKKVALLIQDNDISYINITAKGIEDKKSLYHDLGFTLSYYDVNKLNELFSDKKDKIKYRCYGIMTKSDFLNRLMEDKKVEEKKEKDTKVINSNSGFVSNMILLFEDFIGVEDMITTDMFTYNKIITNREEILKSITLIDVKECISSIDLNNKSTLIIK